MYCFCSSASERLQAASAWSGRAGRPRSVASSARACAARAASAPFWLSCAWTSASSERERARRSRTREVRREREHREHGRGGAGQRQLRVAPAPQPTRAAGGTRSRLVGRRCEDGVELVGRARRGARVARGRVGRHRLVDHAARAAAGCARPTASGAARAAARRSPRAPTLESPLAGPRRRGRRAGRTRARRGPRHRSRRARAIVGVAGSSVRQAARLLGRHVLGRAGDPHRPAGPPVMIDTRGSAPARAESPKSAIRARRDTGVISTLLRLEIAVEHVAQVRVVHAARDVAHPADRLVDRAGRSAAAEPPGTSSSCRGSCSPTSSITMYGRAPSDVEHAHDVVADHVARGARLGERLDAPRRARSGTP